MCGEWGLDFRMEEGVGVEGWGLESIPYTPHAICPTLCSHHPGAATAHHLPQRHGLGVTVSDGVRGG